MKENYSKVLTDIEQAATKVQQLRDYTIEKGLDGVKEDENSMFITLFADNTNNYPIYLVQVEKQESDISVAADPKSQMLT